MKNKYEDENENKGTEKHARPRPTRDSKMNNLICRYNTSVFNSEFRRRLGVTMPPLYSFLDHKQLLNLKLTRDGDTYHLGDQGLNKFVRCIKDAIYCREHAYKVSERENTEWKSVRQQGIPNMQRPVR